MNEKIFLNADHRTSYITPFLLDGDKIRPFVLVIPGGGYHCVCSPSEGAPIAKKFNQLGFHAAVLNYRLNPDFFPAPVEDAIRAMKMIRGNAAEWHVNPNCIAVCGFSAGGHLAACLGTTIAQKVSVKAGDIYDRYDYVPNYLILSYSVLSFARNRNNGSAENFLGKERAKKERMLFSPEKCVTKKTPPAFIWHTITDEMVPCDSSIRFAKAMIAHSRPCELHIFPRGNHGMLLGLNTPDISIWPTLAKRFINAQEKYSPALKKRYTNRYQCFAEKTYPGPEKQD